MRILKKWANSTFYRNLLIAFDSPPDNSGKEYDFEPYFQYKIGPRENDYTLYFSKKPSKLQYKSEIFAKLREYHGNDLANYLDYHYSAHSNKKEFIRFVRYEVQEKLKLPLHAAYKLNLELAFDWVQEQEREFALSNNQHLNTSVNGLAASNNGQPPANGQDSDAKEETFLSRIETKMNSLVESYSGKIALNNQQQMEKVIQVLILLQQLKAPGKKIEQLFSHFSAVDMTGILRQFEELKDKKINTLQLKISAAQTNLRLDDPAVEKLTQALIEFFYQ